MRRLQIHDVVHCSAETAINSSKIDLPRHSSRKKSTESALHKKTCTHARNIIEGQVVGAPIAKHGLQETVCARHRVHPNMHTVARAPQSTGWPRSPCAAEGGCRGIEGRSQRRKVLNARTQLQIGTVPKPSNNNINPKLERRGCSDLAAAHW